MHMKNSSSKSVIKKIKIFILRLLNIIFVPIFGLIPLETRIFIDELFPNDFYRFIAIIFIVIFLFAWFITISHIIYKIENTE